MFRYAILHFDLKTPGREDEDRIPQKADDKSGNKDYALYAQKILVALGGKDNIVAVDNCITRIRLDVLDSSIVDDAAIKAAGASGVLRPSAKSVQVIVGTQVQFVTDELKKLLEK